MSDWSIAPIVIYFTADVESIWRNHETLGQDAWKSFEGLDRASENPVFKTVVWNLSCHHSLSAGMARRRPHELSRYAKPGNRCLLPQTEAINRYLLPEREVRHEDRKPPRQ